MDRRNFNKTLLAAGWAATMTGPAALAESIRRLTKIDADIEAVTRTGGAFGDLAPDSTAYVHRDANFDSIIMSAWKDPAFNEPNIRWLRDSYAGMEPHTIGFYSNHMVASDEPKVRRTFRNNYDRLVTLKNRYDPANLFQLNPNVRPTA